MPGTLSIEHARTKAVRQRGSVTPSHLAALHTLKRLEREMALRRKALDEAWIRLDSVQHFGKVVVHMDHAQQRLHRAIRKIEKSKSK